MKNKSSLLFTIIMSFAFCLSTMAQFVGGNGCGYASATSAIQQLNPTLYNDIQINAITQPANNQSLNINTNYSLAFTVENIGIFPVMPDDSIFFTASINTDLLIDSFFFITPDTLQPGTFTNKLFSDILNFNDSSAAAQLCVTLNGTSFALDSVISNNTFCNTINIIDPSGILSSEFKNFAVYYNPQSKNIVLKNISKIQKINIYNILGKETPLAFFNVNDSEYLVKMNVCNPAIIFLKVYSENMIFTKKILVF